MTMPRLYNAIGLMSGTSLDGIDLALIETDGADYTAPEASHYIPYDDELREAIRAILGQTASTAETRSAEHALTMLHARMVNDFLRKEGLSPAEIDVIGFHGQTIAHAPERGITIQLGDGDLLARTTGIAVVNDFRIADVRAGGEGAPFLPLYHRARARSADLQDTIAVLNIGGVSNVTWIGTGHNEILAFDTGPGNALMDDVILQRLGLPYDEHGNVARKGEIDEALLEQWLSHPFFTREPPKSLDRNAWANCQVDDLPTADALATLAAFTIEANVMAAQYFPEPAKTWYVTGGGRHNSVIMEGLHRALGVPVRPVDSLGWNGDSVEAEGFAYLAVRSLLDKPLSLPSTTGVPRPMTGGVLHKVA